MQIEDFLHLTWANKCFGRTSLKTSCGKPIRILSPGESHIHAGPDFFNARICLDNLELAGNVEIHIRSSDWEKHGHHRDPAYNNVILHVVTVPDAQTVNQRGRRVHQLVISCPPPLQELFLSTPGKTSWIPCRQYITGISPVLLRSWLTKMGQERFRRKGLHIGALYQMSRGNWEECLYLVLASAFGLPVNSLPFEMTVRSVPEAVRTMYRDDLTSLEAVLFGQAGFLHPSIGKGPYHRQLVKLYQGISEQLPRSAVKQFMWKFLRIRPASFPTLRMAQFASFTHRQDRLLEKFLEAGSLAETEQYLVICANEYWSTHYLFGKSAPPVEKCLGRQARMQILINAVIPFLITFGNIRRDEFMVNRGIRMIQELEAESNHVLNEWASVGIVAKDAFESQALIHLHNQYCKRKRCLECAVGIRLFNYQVNE